MSVACSALLRVNLPNRDRTTCSSFPRVRLHWKFWRTGPGLSAVSLFIVTPNAHDRHHIHPHNAATDSIAVACCDML